MLRAKKKKKVRSFARRERISDSVIYKSLTILTPVSFHKMRHFVINNADRFIAFAKAIGPATKFVS